MNNLMVFENHNVEVFEFNGQVLFNPYHVGECLGLAESTVRRAIQNMNKNQVVKLTQSAVHNMNNLVIPTSGKNFLTESGVYKLIFKSRKKEAEKFADWVTDEVLPAIRKTGKYEMKPQEQKLKTFRGVPVMTVRDIMNLTNVPLSTVQWYTPKVEYGRKILRFDEIRQFKEENGMDNHINMLTVLDYHGVKTVMNLIGKSEVFDSIKDKFKADVLPTAPVKKPEMSDAQRADLLLRTIPYLDKKASQELAQQLVSMLLGGAR